MDAALSIALVYFVGSLSPSSLVGRVKKTDVRKSGTGNLGATNTMLVLGWGAGIFVMLFDLMKSFLSGKLAQYVTDFPNDALVGREHITLLPHLGASTPESEDNCAMMAADELSAYLEQGNIINSVNFPNAEMHANGTKLCVLHKNVPTIIAQITSALGDAGKNIDNMVNASKKDNAYTMIDVAGDVADSIVDTVKAIDGVIRVRVIA